VKVGDAICDIQTDKATMAFESQEEGYLGKIIMPDNSQGVKIG
jgi:pyruvate/2-oxoglutarate dehydrogenase complex dihydrolipoamide acyltransferase (E2) component